MGLFDIFRNRGKPENRTAGSAYSFFMGGSAAGKSVTERSAMQMTAVYACVRILSAPGLWMQRITTREPDDSEIECAIAALQCALPGEFPEARAQYNTVKEGEHKPDAAPAKTEEPSADPDHGSDC